MLFTLEALNAKHGDSLILHYGKDESPKHILIDGGPSGVYKDTLQKRLARLAAGGEAPRLEMIMVSHLDSDHINGINALINAMTKADDAQKARPYDTSLLWLNTFESDIKGKINVLSAALEESQSGVHETDLSYPVSKKLPIEKYSKAYISSVKEGISLFNNARRLGLSINSPFDDNVIAPAEGGKIVDMKNGLKLNVIAPDKKLLDDLEEEWKKKCIEIEKAKAKNKMKEAEAIAAEYLDNSVYNLSSIVVLAKAAGKTMLLTGDARGDLIISGLKRAGLLKKKKLHVDLLKLPHHGSSRNLEADFFRTITADNYVISADGKYGNPEIETLKWLLDSRGQQDEYTIYFTNSEKRLVNFFARIKNKNFRVVFRKPKEASVQIKLGR